MGLLEGFERGGREESVEQILLLEVLCQQDRRTCAGQGTEK